LRQQLFQPRLDLLGRFLDPIEQLLCMSFESKCKSFSALLGLAATMIVKAAERW
jgi:hypothetical protein